MKIQASIVAFTLAAAMAAASAQNYKWVDKDGKLRYGDTPPPGVKSTQLKPPPGPVASPAAAGAAAAKDAKKGPLTPVEQEQAFRKRQLDAKAAEEKAQKSQAASAEKAQNCTNARESLAALESGQRIARTDDKGERYFVDDDQREKDIARGREMVKKACD